VITFINVPSHKEIVMTVYPPVGILSMASCLKKHGNRVHFIDADINRLNPKQVVDMLKQDPPHLIGISLNVSQVAHAGSYVQEIHNNFPHVPMILGGPYVTGVQESIFKDFPTVDYAVIHEGEQAIVEFVDFLNGKRSVKEVHNLLYKTGDEICRNQCQRISDLDALPLPDYSLVLKDIHKYPGPYPSIASPSVAVMCTRGCPNNCTFCSSPSNWGRTITFRKPDSVIDELLHLRKTIQVREVFFQDDTLNARPSWFFELCQKIIAHGLHEEIFFKCPFRVGRELVTEELLEKAREANFWMIFYGVESGNQEMLNRMRKNITVSEVIRAFGLTRKKGLMSFASFMVGNDGETRKTVSDSMRLLRRIMPDYGGFAIAAPFPGSDLYRIALEKKLMTVTDFKRYQFGDCILRTDELDVKDIIQLTEKANALFHKVTHSLRYRIINRNSAYRGFYPKELWHTWVNRTMKNVSYTIPLRSTSGNIHMRILADYPDISEKPVKLSISVNGKKETVMLSKNEWIDLTFQTTRKAGSKHAFLHWKVDRTWNPEKFGFKNDNRKLGIVVERIWVD
jgi:anaerobic magnesium-protoporphyrin IX monomethyl ester cyclase